ncbi:MAG: 5-formyltetrahydrofolate cyclo-ligase [Gammaproteobacteria bacterium]|nr:5-formyltetrahydrofolate cyclo-ligase [Gammaproteobacteria bacterium]
MNTVPTSEQSARRELRAQVRAARRALDMHQRQHCAEDCARHLLNHPAFRNARRIAAYLPADGEIDTAPLIERAWDMGKRVYLPVLLPHGENRLWFARYTPDTPLIRNRFGIPEPARAAHTRISPLALDLVLTPLVAFDARGHRLGMGGGLYDRSFAYLLHHNRWLRPRLIGLAYEFQRQARLPQQTWDVPLHAIATDRQLHRCP